MIVAIRRYDAPSTTRVWEGRCYACKLELEAAGAAGCPPEGLTPEVNVAKSRIEAAAATTASNCLRASKLVETPVPAMPVENVLFASAARPTGLGDCPSCGGRVCMTETGRTELRQPSPDLKARRARKAPAKVKPATKSKTKARRKK